MKYLLYGLLALHGFVLWWIAWQLVQIAYTAWLGNQLYGGS